MELEEKAILEETLALTKENNTMLHRVRRVQNRQAWWGVFKFILIISIALGSFYYLEPYLNKLVGLYSQISGKNANIDPSTLQNALRNIR